MAIPQTSAADALLARLQRAQQTCESHGAKLTELREAVLRLILAANEPVGAYTLLDRLRASHANAKPPTVYRALDFLLEQGLIHRVERLNAFVSCVDHPGHRHAAQLLICRQCGQVTELEDPAISQSIAQAAGALGFVPAQATVEVEGNCARCAA